MSEHDFPAAHSMDTEWFAVDAHGNVAYFETHEAGAVPNSAGDATLEEGASLYEAIVQLKPEDGIEYFVDDLLAAPGGPVYEYSWETRRLETTPIDELKDCYCALMHLSDESLLREPEPTNSGIFRRLFTRPSRHRAPVARIYHSQHILGFVNTTLGARDLRDWIERGLVTRAWVNHFLEPERIGVFKYSHGEPFENWIAGPYLRTSQPARPVKIDQLPEALQALFRQTRFPDTDFSRFGAVDPRAAGECSSWDEAWIDLDGTVHRPTEES